VHCGKGVSRSATCIIAYLMKNKGWSMTEALKHVQKCRPIVNPNASFVAQLKEWDSNRLGLEKKAALKKDAANDEEDDDLMAFAKARQAEEEEDVGNEAQIPQEMVKSMACKPKHQNVQWLVKKDGQVIQELSLSQKSMYTIGKGDQLRVKLGRSAVDLRFQHPSISRKHAMLIHNSKGHILLYDAHSSHGTFVDGKRMPPGECWRINNGQKVRFGASTREYELEGAGTKWDSGEDSDGDEPAAKRSKWDDSD